MRHSFCMSEKAQTVLLRLLETYPTTSFQCLILSTITSLADSQAHVNQVGLSLLLQLASPTIAFKKIIGYLVVRSSRKG